MEVLFQYKSKDQFLKCMYVAEEQRRFIFLHDSS